MAPGTDSTSGAFVDNTRHDGQKSLASLPSNGSGLLRDGVRRERADHAQALGCPLVVLCSRVDEQVLDEGCGRECRGLVELLRFGRSGKAMDKRLLTMTEAADALGIGRSKVDALLRAGTLPSIRTDGCRRIPIEHPTGMIAWLRGLTDEPQG